MIKVFFLRIRASNHAAYPQLPRQAVLSVMRNGACARREAIYFIKKVALKKEVTPTEHC